MEYKASPTGGKRGVFKCRVFRGLLVSQGLAHDDSTFLSFLPIDFRDFLCMIFNGELYPWRNCHPKFLFVVRRAADSDDELFFSISGEFQFLSWTL